MEKRMENGKWRMENGGRVAKVMVKTGTATAGLEALAAIQ
jgi:hypothetical protein